LVNVKKPRTPVKKKKGEGEGHGKKKHKDEEGHHQGVMATCINCCVRTLEKNRSERGEKSDREDKGKAPTARTKSYARC